MTLDLQRKADRKMRRLVLALVGVVVVLAGAVVALVLGGGSDSTAPVAVAPASSSASAAPAPTASTTGGSAEPVPTLPAAGAFVAPTKWVTLPKPITTRAGMPAGFPHTADGAAAQGATALRSSWTWDVSVADRAAEAYSVPADLAAMKAAAEQGVSSSRLSVGLPSTGDLPAGAHLAVATIGVQWTAVSADEVRVSVLARVVYTPGAGTAETTQLISTTNSVVWADGDWRSKTTAAQKSPDPADLGTNEFNTAGWTAIQEGDTR